MDIQKKAFKNRVDSLKRENKKLSEKLAALKKEKLQVERNLRSAQKLLSGIPGPVILVQGQHIVFANEMAWAMLGYSERALLDQKLFDLVHPKSSEFAKTMLQRLHLDKAIPDQFEVYLKKKNGEPFCCEVLWKKIRYHGKTAYLYNLISLDQRKQAEIRSSESQKIQAIARMANWLSRDFSKGFKIISDHFSQFMVTESVRDKKVLRSLRRFEAAMEVGNQVSQKLNCLTRQENAPSDVVLFDLKKVVQDAVAISAPQWDEDGIAPVEIKAYLRTLSPIEGHAVEIRDAIVSVILNAVDAMPEGGEIYLTTEENAGFAWIYIQDSGTGIPDDIKDKIFDPFFTTKGGRGLGLSLARAIITRNGGEIEVISQRGQGATFAVKLPISKLPEVTPKAKYVKNRIRDSRILMISADSIASDLLTQELAGKGGKVTIVYGFLEGLKLLRRKAFDLVVADIETPDLEVPDIVKKIKKIKKDLPIVLADGGYHGTPFLNLKESGADLVLERPLEMDGIMSRISDIIASKATPE